ncbi:LysM peptidoglycan-binding domain-containing protein [Solilutibacter tolerans]|uniref:Potassium binding protein Kbp n=1 Tax=Solilutibacter tolerans TaxID=1604334 RepID=A0A1N6S7B6_9GAMM|nr:LysM peptidoglycan-binding domain-containing protein [Lysobacter tolerans]SIQ36930.1 LysM domain-containing protein [Lysobacter tolerans]
MANANNDPNKLSLAGGSSSANDKADFSAVTGGSSAVVGAGGGVQSYTVQSGDSLSKIAKQVYGDASQWQRIFEANRDQIDDPDKIFPGQTFKIP